MRFVMSWCIAKTAAKRGFLGLLLGMSPALARAADGHVLIRYRPVAALAESGSASRPEPAAAAASRVDINQAGAAELEAGLDGIGPAKAAAIIAWREQNGPFRSLEDLLDVKGIGPAFLEKNRLRLALPATPAHSSPTSAKTRVSEPRRLLQKPTGVRLD